MISESACINILVITPSVSSNLRKELNGPCSERRNSILITHHYPDLGSTSDWLKRNSLAFQPVRSTTQIWVVTRHQYGISALVTQTSFCEGPSGDLAKRWLFSQAMKTLIVLKAFSKSKKSKSPQRFLAAANFISRSTSLMFFPMNLFLINPVWSHSMRFGKNFLRRFAVALDAKWQSQLRKVVGHQFFTFLFQYHFNYSSSLRS